MVPADMTYKQWYEKYVKGNPKAEAQEKAVKNAASSDQETVSISTGNSLEKTCRNILQTSRK